MSRIVKTTLAFLVDGDRVLLGLKKRGFGAGWWNGFGGKLEPEESFEDCARRETREEVGIIIKDLRLEAKLLFYFENKLEVACQAFVSSDFSGTPVDTEEMRPQWFNQNELPFDTMWPGDKHWIPKVFKLEPSNEPMRLAVYFDSNNDFERLSEPDGKIVEEVF